MKPITIYLVLMALGFTMLVIADLISGLTIDQSYQRLMTPFGVITPFEHIVIVVALALPVIPVVKRHRKRKRQASRK